MANMYLGIVYTIGLSYRRAVTRRGLPVRMGVGYKWLSFVCSVL